MDHFYLKVYTQNQLTSTEINLVFEAQTNSLRVN